MTTTNLVLSYIGCFLLGICIMDVMWYIKMHKSVILDKDTIYRLNNLHNYNPTLDDNCVTQDDKEDDDWYSQEDFK